MSKRTMRLHAGGWLVMSARDMPPAGRGGRAWLKGAQNGEGNAQRRRSRRGTCEVDNVSTKPALDPKRDKRKRRAISFLSRRAAFSAQIRGDRPEGQTVSRTPEIVDLNAEVAKLTMFRGRTPRSTMADRQGSAARLTSYRDGALTATKFAGKGHWEKHIADELIHILSGMAMLSTSRAKVRRNRSRSARER
jgi:hypothetical protein